jgi:hypothetical protein
MIRSKETPKVGGEAGAGECVYHILNCKSKQIAGQCSFGLIVRYITISEKRGITQVKPEIRLFHANNLHYYA